ncbi:RING finger protein unkempt-like, partial [Tropilaelaps mercedesae]
TGICVYDTDGRGHCVKNGPHCAFAHGLHDLRNPVYDIREIQGKILNEDGTEVDANGVLVTNSLDKDRNAISEDPRWQDTNYVLGNYKTEACKRPPRLCRQGYACPQYHNSRDKRRPPQKFKYRSTPCPNVKQGDEWGDPVNCDGGDQCTYCHTRTEQQFHPEIYKSTKCNDMQQTSFCPRGPFCAFAHVDKEMSAVRELVSAAEAAGGTNLASILSNVLPPGPASSPNAGGSAGGNQNNKPPQENGSATGSLEMQQQHAFSMGPIGRPRSYSTSHAAAVQHHLQLKTMESALPHYQKAPGCEREEQAMRKHRAKTMDGPHSGKDWPTSLSSGYGFPNTVESVVGKALDEIGLEDIDVEACLDKDLVEECTQPNHNLNHVHPGHNHSHNPVASSLNQGLVNSGLIPHPTPNATSSSHPLQHTQLPGNNSQPVNIPGRERQSSSPSSLVGSIDKSAAAFYGSPFGAPSFGGYGGSVVAAPPSPSSRLWPDAQPPGGPGAPGGGNNLSNLSNMNSGGMWSDPQVRAMGLRQLDLEHLSPQQLRALQEQLRSELDTVDKVSQLQQERLRMAGLQQMAGVTSQTGSQGGVAPGQQRHLTERDYWTGPPGRGHC